MRDLLDYPLAAFRSAFHTILGWTAIMAITTIAGFAVPWCIKEGSLAPLWQAPCVLPGLAFYAFFRLPLLGAFMGTALGWSLGLNSESLRSRVVIAVVNTALWAAVAVWARLPYD